MDLDFWSIIECILIPFTWMGDNIAYYLFGSPADLVAPPPPPANFVVPPPANLADPSVAAAYQQLLENKILLDTKLRSTVLYCEQQCVTKQFLMDSLAAWQSSVNDYLYIKNHLAYYQTYSPHSIPPGTFETLEACTNLMNECERNLNILIRKSAVSPADKSFIAGVHWYLSQISHYGFDSSNLVEVKFRSDICRGIKAKLSASDVILEYYRVNNKNVIYSVRFQEDLAVLMSCSKFYMRTFELLQSSGLKSSGITNNLVMHMLTSSQQCDRLSIQLIQNFLKLPNVIEPNGYVPMFDQTYEDIMIYLRRLNTRLESNKSIELIYLIEREIVSRPELYIGRPDMVWTTSDTFGILSESNPFGDNEVLEKRAANLGLKKIEILPEYEYGLMPKKLEIPNIFLEVIRNSPPPANLADPSVARWLPEE
jgi:hypothetical protein